MRHQNCYIQKDLCLVHTKFPTVIKVLIVVCSLVHGGEIYKDETSWSFSAWWVTITTTILYNYGTTLCEFRYNLSFHLDHVYYSLYELSENSKKCPILRACLHGGEGPQVGEVTRVAVIEKLNAFTCNLTTPGCWGEFSWGCCCACN